MARPPSGRLEAGFEAVWKAQSGGSFLRRQNCGPEGGARLIAWDFGLCQSAQVVVIVLRTEQVRKWAQ